MHKRIMDWALTVDDVPPQCVAVLVGLARHADKDGATWPSAETLAGYARKSRRQVLKDLHALVEQGVTRVADDQSPAGYLRADRRPVVYQLVMHGVNWTTPREAVADSAQGGSRGELQNTPDKPARDVVQFTPSARGEPDGVPSSSPRGLRGEPQDTPQPEQMPHGVNHSSPEEEPSVSTYVGNSPSKDLSSSEPADAAPDPKNDREDVKRLCALLADLIEGNGSKRPAITKGWQDAARLMLDIDEREADKAEALIRWTQANGFWRSNVLSMPKFREQYDQLRLKALAEWERGHTPPSQSRTRPAQGFDDHWRAGHEFGMPDTEGAPR